jgi:polyhydroxyalkanoate synthesis repressor PhaR
VAARQGGGPADPEPGELTTMSPANEGGPEPIIIKKYANRRLYNTASSSYVTLDHLCQMVKDGVDFVVQDAKSGEDITRTVLTQIIFEEENRGENLLPIGFLRQIIRFYDDSLKALVPSYLEHSMQSFAKNQAQMRDYMEKTLGGIFPMNHVQEWSRQNARLFQQALDMFGAGGGVGVGAREAAEPAKENEGRGGEIDDLRRQLAEMRKEIESLSRGGKD